LDAIGLIERYGIPVVVLIAVSLACVAVWKFVAKEIILPLRDRLIQRVVAFFDRLDLTLDRIEKREAGLDDTLRRHEDILWHILELAQGTGDLCERMGTHILGEPPRRAQRRPTRPTQQRQAQPGQPGQPESHGSTSNSP
jgi:hypothetical protein